jgi:hypothetical protein
VSRSEAASGVDECTLAAGCATRASVSLVPSSACWTISLCAMVQLSSEAQFSATAW